VKPVAAVVAITLLVLSGLLGALPFAGAGGVAQAAESGAPAIVPNQAPGDGPVRLDLAQVSPRVVTVSGPRILTVTSPSATSSSVRSAATRSRPRERSATRSTGAAPPTPSRRSSSRSPARSHPAARSPCS
jgi:hypothetical protein